MSIVLMLRALENSSSSLIKITRFITVCDTCISKVTPTLNKPRPVQALMVKKSNKWFNELRTISQVY